MKLYLGLAVGAATMATTAIAQRVPVPDRSPDFQPSGTKVGNKDTRRVVQEFARCLTRRSMSGAAEFLNQQTGGLPPALRARAPDCLGASFDGDSSMLKGQSDTYRYALAEAYLVRKYREAGVGDLASVAPLVHSGETGPNGVHALGTLSECIVRKSPAESWALLRTDAASAKEKTTFASLGPAMQSCVTRGTTVKMQAFFMRGAIAQTYYRLSQAPRTSSGSAN